jgi:uncharacterized protein YqeY
MKNELNGLIMQAMKEHKKMRLEALRAVKTAFLNWETSKEHAGKELTEADEIQIIKKLVKQREESIEQFMAAGRDELANEEHMQMTVLKEFLPAEATEEDIVRVFLQVKDINEWEPIKKNMGLFVKEIKKALPTADGKLVATTVQKHLS